MPAYENARKDGVSIFALTSGSLVAHWRRLETENDGRRGKADMALMCLFQNQFRTLAKHEATSLP